MLTGFGPRTYDLYQGFFSDVGGMLMRNMQLQINVSLFLRCSCHIHFTKQSLHLCKYKVQVKIIQVRFITIPEMLWPTLPVSHVTFWKDLCFLDLLNVLYVALIFKPLLICLKNWITLLPDSVSRLEEPFICDEGAGWRAERGHGLGGVRHHTAGWIGQHGLLLHAH